MKIGIDCRAIGQKRTGDETYVSGLVNHLAKIDHRNEYNLYFNQPPKDSWIFPRQPSFIPKIVTPKQKLLWTFFSLPRFIKKNPIDILHTQYITPQFSVPSATKIITSIHDISYEYYPQFIKKSDLIALKTLIPQSIKKADHILAISEFSKKTIIEKYKTDPNKISVIYLGPSSQSAQPKDETELETVRQKYSLPKKFILYLGTFQPRKNIPALIKAFHQLKKSKNLPGLKLVLAGNLKAHNSDPKISQTISELDLKKEIYLPGFIDEKDKTNIYKLASVFAFPSLFEGFGLPLIEAMAVGTPVVTSNHSCLPEIAAGAAEIVDPKNSEEFAQSLNQLITSKDLRNKYIIDGYERAKFFSWKKTAEQTLALYETLNRTS